MKFSWPSVAALAAVLLFLFALVALKVDTGTIGGLSAASMVVLSLLGPIFKRDPGQRDTPIDPHAKPDLGEDTRGGAPHWALGIAFCIAAAFILGMILGLGGCSPDAKSPPREVARAAFYGVEKGVSLADKACSDLAKLKNDERISDACAEAYAVARGSLSVVADGINAWQAVDERQTLCAVSRSAAALSKMADIMKQSGGTVPPEVADMVRFAGMVGGCS